MSDNIKIILLTNKNDTKVSISNLGAIINSFIFKKVNIVLGFGEMQKYLSDEYHREYPYFGAMIGRYANRIAGARFMLDGHSFNVSQNHGLHQLHGGKEGFDKKIWEIVHLPEANVQSLTMRLVSPDGDEGFPGRLIVTTNFTLDDDDALTISTRAETDSVTPVNFTHHDYFNLNGTGTIHHHSVCVEGDYVLEQDSSHMPSGNLKEVQNTRFDFRQFRKLAGQNHSDSDFDHSFVCRHNQPDRIQASCIGEVTGIRLDVFSNQPVIHFYTGSGIRRMHFNGKDYFGPFAGMCFEAQIHPNAVNIPAFPNSILHPGQTYVHIVKYKLSKET